MEMIGGVRQSAGGGENMVSIGEKAPDFELSNDAGETVRLSDFLGRKVILYFYPKALSKG
jgi:peroxiredoxin Q/BCP